MSTSLTDVCGDHRDEISSFAEMLKVLSERTWRLATPAPGWAIADQVAHLAMFDERALWAMSDPERFIADRTKITTGGQYAAIHTQWASQAPTQLFEQWHNGAMTLNEVAMGADPSTRCEWYGPAMSITSKMTARIMETWAHAHDVADTVGVDVTASSRLRHVAHIGVRSRKFAFVANSRVAPLEEPFVELHTPSGDRWTWGEPAASDVVRGSALGFCQLVTQRRHLDDTDVVATGDGAVAWVKIAQAFAGPPGKGRTAGQFTTAT
jgi:uncharacterized protein (TIGR03084 family)